MRKWMLAFVIALSLILSVADASITTTQVTVAVTATSLVGAQPFDQDVAISNRGSGAAIFVGDSTVLTSTGFQLDQDATISITALANTEVFGIVATGTETAHVIIVN